MSRRYWSAAEYLALALFGLSAAGCGAQGSTQPVASPAEEPTGEEQPLAGVRDSTQPVASPEMQPWEVRYETDATIDPASGKIHARTGLAFRADGGTEGAIALLLNRGLEVQRVDGSAVRAHRVRESDFSPAWNLIEIDLDMPAAREEVVIELAYEGVLDMGGAVGGVTASAIELSLENMWHPLMATFDREMAGALRLRLPEGWMVVSSGASQVVDGMYTLDMWVPQLDVPLFAAPGLTQWSDGGFSVYSLVATEAEARAVLEAASACAGFLNGQFGQRDRLPELRFVIVDRDEVAMARKTYVVLSRVDPTDRLALHQHICHELAHYWTGSAGPFTPDHWMSESFAEYASALYLRDRFGAEAFGQRIAEYERAGRGHGPVWTPAAASRPSFPVMYQLGPYVLSRLEQRIGEDDFAEFIRGYMVDDIRTTEDLLRHLRAVAGSEAEQWFRAELARPQSRSRRDRGQ